MPLQAQAWHEETLRASLREPLPGWHVELLPEIDSTSSELMRRGHQSDYRSTVLLAEHQSAGRGRSGQAWLSEPRQSLTVSMARTLAPSSWMGLSLACGVGVVQALSAYLPADCATDGLSDPHITPRLGLKWPNDLWAWDASGPAKVGGLLIETQSLRAPHVQACPQVSTPARFCVVGLGLNLRTPQSPAWGTLSPPPKGLVDLGVTLATRAQAHALLASVVVSLAHTLNQFEAHGFAAFQHEFDRMDCLRGRQVTLSDTRHGQAMGVNEQGELLLGFGNEVHCVQASSVSLRPA